nr:keratin-associated protein 21-1-like [Loxodonta africana]
MCCNYYGGCGYGSRLQPRPSSTSTETSPLDTMCCNYYGGCGYGSRYGCGYGCGYGSRYGCGYSSGYGCGCCSYRPLCYRKCYSSYC